MRSGLKEHLSLIFFIICIKSETSYLFYNIIFYCKKKKLIFFILRNIQNREILDFIDDITETIRNITTLEGDDKLIAVAKGLFAQF